MAEEDDYLTTYRVFFENFAATVNPEDQLPVHVAGYRITEAELPGEALYWTTQYLTEKQCPATLMTPLRRIIVEEVRTAAKKQPSEFGYNSDESAYIALRLMQAVTSHVNAVCLRYLDNSQLDALPPPSGARELRTTSAAIKNSRRCMEDRHVEVANLEALFGLEGAETTGFYAVYDGHAGSAAATYCAAHLHQYLCESAHFAGDLRLALTEAFLRTDAEFVRKANQERACGGSTAVVVAVRGSKLHAAWAGDSQALLAKRMRLMQLVHPHKPSRKDERERIEASGGTVMFWGTWRVNGQLAVSRAIGDAQYKPYVTARPELCTVDLDGDEDFVVVACDGLWDFVSEDQAALAVYWQLAADPDDLKAVTKRLIVQAKRQGSADNISVIVVFLKDPREIVADNCPPMDVGLDNALPNAPPFVGVEGEVCADAGAGAVDVGVENSDSDSEDLGPETAVDVEEDAEVLRQRAERDVERREAPTPPAHAVHETNSALVDNVAESGDESEDEWNYYQGEQKAREETEEPLRSESACQDNSAWDSSSGDMNSSPLNPDAPVFVPGSDVLIAESPRKPVSMDDIELPDRVQFETEATARPAELLDLDNCDQLNGHHNLLLNEKSNEHHNGNEKSEIDTLGFGFNMNLNSDKPQDKGLLDDFERVQKDTTDFIQVCFAHTETNPVSADIDEELFERLKNKERDPMSMSFYQEKDDDTSEPIVTNVSHVDLNAVQTLPDSEDEQDTPPNGLNDHMDIADKENIFAGHYTEKVDDFREPDNDIIQQDDRSDLIAQDLANFGLNVNHIEFGGIGTNQRGTNLNFCDEVNQDQVLQTDTPESHKLLFEQIPEIPDGKSSELGFVSDEIQDESENEFKLTPNIEQEASESDNPYCDHRNNATPEVNLDQDEISHKTNVFLDNLEPEVAIAQVESNNLLPEEDTEVNKSELNIISNEVQAVEKLDVMSCNLDFAPSAELDLKDLENPSPMFENNKMVEDVDPAEPSSVQNIVISSNTTDVSEINGIQESSPVDVNFEDNKSIEIETNVQESNLKSEISGLVFVPDNTDKILLTDTIKQLDDIALTPCDNLSNITRDKTVDLEELLVESDLQGIETRHVSESQIFSSEIKFDKQDLEDTDNLEKVSSPLPDVTEEQSKKTASVFCPTPDIMNQGYANKFEAPLSPEVPEHVSELRLTPEVTIDLVENFSESRLTPEVTSETQEIVSEVVPSPEPQVLDTQNNIEDFLTQDAAEEPFIDYKSSVEAVELLSGNIPDIVPEPCDKALSDLLETGSLPLSPVSDVDINMKESRAQEICMPISNEINSLPEDLVVQPSHGDTISNSEKGSSTPPPTPAVDLSVPQIDNLAAAVDKVLLDNETPIAVDVVPELAQEATASLEIAQETSPISEIAQEAFAVSELTAEATALSKVLQEGAAIPELAQEATASPEVSKDVIPGPADNHDVVQDVNEDCATIALATGAAGAVAVASAVGAGVATTKNKTLTAKKPSVGTKAPASPTKPSVKLTTTPKAPTSSVKKTAATPTTQKTSTSASKTPAPTAKTPTSVTKLSASKLTSASKPSVPKLSLASKPSSATKLTSSLSKESTTTKASAVPAKTTAPSKPALKPAPTKLSAPSTRTTVATSKPASTVQKAAALPTTRPAPIRAPKAPTTTAPKPKPPSAATTASKPAEKKPLTNGEVRAPIRKPVAGAVPAAAKPAPRPPTAARPTPRPSPRAAAPLDAPTTNGPNKVSAPKPAPRAAPRPALDKQSKDLANKRLTAKAAPPRTNAKALPATKSTGIKGLVKKSVVEGTVKAVDMPLTNGAGDADVIKAPPSPPPVDNALLPDVIA